MRRRAYSYIRFSTPDQIKGDSLRRQLEATTKWCERNDCILDDSLNLRDLGVSGFSGRNVETGRLGAFLQAVKEGRIERGSVLLVENLDRLTRAAVRSALSLFLSILDAGITIVTVDPPYTFDPEEQINDTTNLLIAIITLARGHGESARKSYLGGEAWKNKRARIKKEKLTAKCPAWLRLNEDRTEFLTIPDKVLLVQRIFRDAIAGTGLTALTKQLNQEGVKPLGYGIAWHKSYVLKILKNRAVLGEYQPHTGHGAKARKPIGEPIPNYYPAIVSEADFYRAQTALTARRNRRGPIGKNVANLFTGLLRDATDGGTLTLVNKGTKSSGASLVSSAATRGDKGSKYVSFPYAAFERAVIEWTKEIRAEDLSPTAKPEVDELAVAQGRLADLELRLAAFRESLLTSPNFQTILQAVEVAETEKATLVATVERLKAEQAATNSRPLAYTQDLVRLLDTTKGDDLIDLRLRLRAALATIITEIWVDIDWLGTYERQAMVQIHFRTGGYRRLVLIAKRGQLESWGNEEIKPGAPQLWDLRNVNC